MTPTRNAQMNATKYKTAHYGEYIISPPAIDSPTGNIWYLFDICGGSKPMRFGVMFFEEHLLPPNMAKPEDIEKIAYLRLHLALERDEADEQKASMRGRPTMDRGFQCAINECNSLDVKVIGNTMEFLIEKAREPRTMGFRPD